MPVSVSSAINSLKQATDYAASSGASTLSTSNSGSTSASGASNQASGAFASMAGNENNFLKLLTTQLQHQDPTSPMKNDQLASQLAQFSAVEQQVQTNKNLSALISLNESSQLTQNRSMVGQTASAQTSTLPLQSGAASLSVGNTSPGQIIGISVANAAGQVVKSDVLESSGGSNAWRWDGKSNDGTQLSDGPYSVSVKTVDGNGTTTDVPFSVNGKITGITKGDSGVSVQMGGAVIPMSNVQSISS